ncbi:hypothetical protein POM88_040427 [Heracleum sosnowskyi]|uniref:Uncharacterized protein n=1 Tax=Heracleum sosnowskyi TaxID=360622 RepID=A0AAD8HD78_9APIA|nr:hypothetical protein POM88_040427 [Heracleum sosnowskyi]
MTLKYKNIYTKAFLNRRVKKFRRYYYYPKGFTKGEANSVVREHLRRNMKQTMFIMKKNASKEVEKALKKGENKKRHDFRPPFLEEDAWMGCCDYWETRGHEKMSKINTENRKYLTFPHANGAMPFEQRPSPRKGKPFMYPHHTVRELLGLAEAAAWTSLSTPTRILEHAYEMMGRALNEVTDMVQAMDGVDEVPRSCLDEELRKLADGAYPSKDDPTQLVFWDQYMKISTNLTASLFERYKKVVIEDMHAHDQVNDQVDDQANDGNANRRNNDEETIFNNVPLIP